MEMVSTAKLKKAQARAEGNRPYSDKMLDLLRHLAASGSSSEHPLMQAHDEVKKARIIVVTSDRGLCGSFNTNITNLVLDKLVALKDAGKEVEVWCLGKKGASTFGYRGVNVHARFEKVTDNPTFTTVETVGGALIKDFLSGEIDQGILTYSKFISPGVQKATQIVLLPFSDSGDQKDDNSDRVMSGEYLFEPTPASILDQLVPMAVKTAIFTALLETSAGEHAARRMAMKNATDSADDMITMLTRQYNRVRQGKITQEISEIVGAAEAL